MDNNPNLNYHSVDTSVNDCTNYIQSADGRYGFRLQFDHSMYNRLPRYARRRSTSRVRPLSVRITPNAILLAVLPPPISSGSRRATRRRSPSSTSESRNSAMPTSTPTCCSTTCASRSATAAILISGNLTPSRPPSIRCWSLTVAWTVGLHSSATLRTANAASICSSIPSASGGAAANPFRRAEAR